MGEQSDNFPAMLTTISGTYDKGVVSLDERPVLSAPAKVIVTFLSEPMPQAMGPDLAEPEVAELRGKLAAWDGDWNAPGMEAYDRL